MMNSINIDRLAKWIYVSGIPYLGPVRFRNLYENLGERIDDIFRMSENELLTMKGIITSQVISGIQKQRPNKEKAYKFASEQIKKAVAAGGEILLLSDSDYPEFLKNSSMCHPVLYAMGRIKRVVHYDKSIAIVGSREASEESNFIAFNTAAKLASKGWVIISGMAKGIDASAHSGALSQNGKTIAVLGGGPDIIYPKENKDIYHKILENGAVFSEYPFGARPQSLNLKKRNKTIVGFSQGIFVVETKIDGGAMNAYIGSKEQKKPAFTIKKDSKNFSGNLKILEEGGVEFSGDLEVIFNTLKKWSLKQKNGMDGQKFRFP